MAVQKTKRSKSKKNMRRSHSALKLPALSIDNSGTLHIRHCVNMNTGFYRGKKVLELKSS